MREAMEQNLLAICERMQNACVKSGRSLEDVKLIWVSKTKGIDAVQAARALGAIHFGETRLQEAQEKFSTKANAKEQLHIIGPVQSNKLRKAVELADYIHTLSDPKKLSRLDAIAGELGIKQKILFQINTSGEQSKSGIPLSDALEWFASLGAHRNLLYSGLMTIPFNGGGEDLNRAEFRALRQLLVQLQEKGGAFEAMKELSMGMSADLEWAIEEGATMIRVGSALFGSR